MKPEYRPRTPDEELAISQMKCVSFPVGSWDKRFFRALSSGNEITDKQAPQLWRLLILYRRQINFPAKARLLQLAEKLSAPDLRKEQAKEREKRKLKEYVLLHGKPQPPMVVKFSQLQDPLNFTPKKG